MEKSIITLHSQPTWLSELRDALLEFVALSILPVSLLLSTVLWRCLVEKSMEGCTGLALVSYVGLTLSEKERTMFFAA